jgi:hypothetical protein
MELLGDIGHVESHVVLFGDSVSASAKCLMGARFAPKYHRLKNHFGHTRWYT